MFDKMLSLTRFTLYREPPLCLVSSNGLVQSLITFLISPTGAGFLFAVAQLIISITAAYMECEGDITEAHIIYYGRGGSSILTAIILEVVGQPWFHSRDVADQNDGKVGLPTRPTAKRRCLRHSRRFVQCYGICPAVSHVHYAIGHSSKHYKWLLWLPGIVMFLAAGQIEPAKLNAERQSVDDVSERQDKHGRSGP
jgi:hypothetical protein